METMEAFDGVQTQD